MGQYLTFDGVSTSTYDVYVSGEGVFNAPERDVEAITIPGRNGDFQLDKGRFHNIEVTYPAFNFETDMSNFRTKLSNLRNAFASRQGYKRLTDTFHPDEYRMATFKSGLEVDPIKYNTASQFDIVFDCKPQRFLTSGETATAVANNGTISNPTLFSSSPVLQVWGYGDITIAGQTVSVANTSLGWLGFMKIGSTYYIEQSRRNTGDTIALPNDTTATFYYQASGSTLTSIEVSYNGDEIEWTSDVSSTKAQVMASLNDLTFTAGTYTTKSSTCAVTIGYKVGSTSYTTTFNVTVSVQYFSSSSNDKITLTKSSTFNNSYMAQSISAGLPQPQVNSTKSALGQPLYIDCEVGQAYVINNSVMSSANAAVSLPAELPVLKPGSNTVTYPNTVTQFKIVPRWWTV